MHLIYELVLLGCLLSLISHGLSMCHMPISLQRSNSEDQAASVMFGCLLCCHLTCQHVLVPLHAATLSLQVWHLLQEYLMTKSIPFTTIYT